MVSVSQSFTVLLPPEKIWRSLTDFNHWGNYVVVKDAANKGWGNRWQVQGEPGQSMRLSLFNDQKLAQEWSVQEWSPAKHLRLASFAWHGVPQLAMASCLDFTLSPTSPVETRVTIAIDSRFSHPLAGFFLNFVPMKGEFRGILNRFERGLVAALSGG